MGTAANAASTITADYFSVLDTAGGPDFNVCCSSPPATLPVIALGSGLSGGMPVTTLPFSSGGVYDQSGGQIQWGTPGVNNIVSLGSSVITIGAGGYSSDMYVPGGQGDSVSYETAILKGTFTSLGGPASVTVGSDDDAFVYVNGKYVGGNPGVHGVETNTFDFSPLAGANSIEVFYADRAQTGASLSFNVSNIVTSAVPEPATWAMMLVGLGGLGVAMRSRRRLAAAAV